PPPRVNLTDSPHSLTAKPMSTLPHLTARAVRAWVDDRSYDLGRKYYDDGALFDTRRQGSTLKAMCRGSSGGPYRVQAALGDDGVEKADCSCPVGDGGHCKHVAALLLAWARQPGSFREVEDTDAALQRRSKAELVALVKLMLRRQPELESLLETPLPGEGKR